jgi:hypothetical protein
MDPSGLIAALIVFVVLSVVEHRREERARVRLREALEKLAEALARPAAPSPPERAASPQLTGSSCRQWKALLAGAPLKERDDKYLN